MKKLIRLFMLLSAIGYANISYSESTKQVDPGFYLVDVLLYRPVGLVATIAGTSAFVAISPLLGLASIPEPHDAFQKTAGILVLAPAAYTFIRPIGDRDFPYITPLPRRTLSVTTQNTQTAQPPIVSPAAPANPPKQSNTPGMGL